MNTIIDYLLTGRSLKRAYNKFLSKTSNVYGLSGMETNVLLFLYNNPGYDTASDIVELRSFKRIQGCGIPERQRLSGKHHG